MTRNKIDVVLYAFKEKERVIREAVTNILDTATSSDIHIEIIDQSSTDKAKSLKDILVDGHGTGHSVVYESIKWDDMAGPIHHKLKKLNNLGSPWKATITTDIRLKEGWDSEIINFIKGGRIMVSGLGRADLEQANLFELKASRVPTPIFHLSQYVDRNFMFASSETWNSFMYPNFIKYAAEEELVSLILVSQNIAIYNLPEHLAEDQGRRTIENMYHCFSKEHNYNKLIKVVQGDDDWLMEELGITKDGIRRFSVIHGIDFSKLHRLPYLHNDVLYDMNELDFNEEVDARRYIAGTKAIY